MLDTNLAIAFFAGLSPAEQLRFLLKFAHSLTVAAREAYEFEKPGVDEPGLLRTFNEVQHRISAHALALLNGSAQRYPDDVLMRIVLEDKLERERCGIEWAFRQAHDALRRTNLVELMTVEETFDVGASGLLLMPDFPVPTSWKDRTADVTVVVPGGCEFKATAGFSKTQIRDDTLDADSRWRIFVCLPGREAVTVGSRVLVAPEVRAALIHDGA